ncbi:hypothetical protein ElyMa_005969800 [Elysia marginata]|uniref:Uncharacterized protein n=1 Tax=Elysia marginata TaxID=1093978 RepID=A0AAV4GDN8_9GAST|nr:hypothetical protein ElyMa_005969800 [Elysia marginata]
MGRLLKHGAPVGLASLLLALVIVATTTSAFSIPGWEESSDRVLRFAQQDNTTSSAAGVASGRPPRFVLIIEVTKSNHIITPRYMSITISGGQMSKGLEGFDFK